MSTQKNRKRILQIVYEEHGRNPLQKLDVEDLTHHIDISWSDLQREVTYLEEKGWITLRNRQVGPRIFQLIHLTAQGIDVVEEEMVDESIEKYTFRQSYLRKLLEIISTYFDKEELKTLCFNLGVDYDDLPAEGKTNKARELIKYLKRRDLVSELKNTGAQQRPDISWEDIL